MKLTKNEIRNAVHDTKWQAFRKSLKGLPTDTKLDKLYAYLYQHQTSYNAHIQVQNYINALKRGGILKLSTEEQHTFRRMALIDTLSYLKG